MPADEPIEHELLRNAVIAELTVTKTDVSPTSIGDRHVRIEGRLGDDEEIHVEWAALGFIYALGVLSFAAARPRGVSGMDFEEHDQWSAADLLRHLRYEAGRLVRDADYVRGRMMKTTVTVFPDGRFTLVTVNRGEAASRWVAQLQGKKVLRLLPAGGWGGTGGVTEGAYATYQVIAMTVVLMRPSGVRPRSRAGAGGLDAACSRRKAAVRLPPDGHEPRDDREALRGRACER